MNPRPRVSIRPEQRPPEGARAIPLNGGWVAWVDEDVYADLSQDLWCVDRRGSCAYATRNRRGARKAALQQGESRYMHRVVMPTAKGREVEHRKHRTEIRVVDNRRSNLRPATDSQNQGNSRRPDGGSSVFKGVTWDRSRSKWQARIGVDYETRHLGRFVVEAHAALAYDLAAVKHFGAFALTNFPVPGSKNWIFG